MKFFLQSQNTPASPAWSVALAIALSAFGMNSLVLLRLEDMEGYSASRPKPESRKP